ncbi:aspartic peptidase [Tanacetum coccineum]
MDLQNESDDEDVENGYDETIDDVARDKSNTKGASNPIENGSNLERVCNKVFMKWKWASNNRFCTKGSCILISWNDNVMDVVVLSCTSQAIHTQVMLKADVGYRALENGGSRLQHVQACEKDEVQMALDKDPSSITLREEESVYLTAFTQETFDEERFLKQKSKIEWLQVGDTNSKFFHKLVKARVSRSRIDCITGHDNAIYKGNLVPNVFIQHYMQFIGTDNGVYPFNHEGLFVRRLSTDKAANMIRCVSDDKIRSVMFSIGNDKAPGPDGYTLVFFKESWDIVGTDVCKAVRDFFSNGKLLQEINHTSLLPKISTPTRLNDYWPISCCNVIYKCISKIITNRIKDGLDDIISDNQSAFVPGRSISNNILLTQELMHNYHLNRGPPRYAFKIDIQKAYDTVNWKFLEDILVAFGFHSNMVKWIMACVTNTSFSIDINDLIMFARGGVQSARILIEALDEFKRVSGLVPKLEEQDELSFADTVNIALMTSHIWKLITHKESMYVRWIHAYKLKKRSLWEVPLVSNVSWGWRKLLQIHNTVRPYFWYKIGNGEKASIWYDTWDELCPLMNHVSYRGLSNAGFDRQETVTNVVSNGSWT